MRLPHMMRLLILLLTASTCLPLAARRTVTPLSASQAGHNYLTDSLPGDEWVDSVAAAQPKAIGNIYPLLDAVQVNLDLWPALNRAFKSGYGIAGIGAKLSLHNRYFPAIEAGISSASYSPKGMNFSFKSPAAPYFKIGMDYNFLYNSNPDYKIYAMARYGLAAFNYRFTDVTLDAPYWGTSETLDFPRHHSVTGYVEVGAGLQVKLFGPLSAGWSVCYHHIIHRSAAPNGAPWAIPGYGTASGSVGLSLTLTYTIPLHSPIIKTDENPDIKDPDNDLPND